MADGDCRIIFQQQRCHRFAHDVASADDNTVLSCDVDAVFLKHCNDSARSCWCKALVPDAQKSNVDRMEAVHILFRQNRAQNRLFVNLLWQRQLYQDSVHRFILIQSLYHLQQLLLGGLLGHGDNL